MRSTIAVVLLLGGFLSVLGIRGSSEDEGARLAKTYCQSCHLLPEPSALDRPTWVAKVFPMMRRYMGMDPVEQRDRLPHDLQSFYPQFPQMSEDEWFAIAQWYIDQAPVAFPPPEPVQVRGTTEQFLSRVVTSDARMPLSTLVRIDEKGRRLIVGDGIMNRLSVYTAAGDLLSHVPVGGPPSWLEIRGESWYVTDMGKLLPHDSAAGRLIHIQWQNGNPVTKVLFDSLRRPTNVVVADLNGNNVDDFLICEYGNLIGRFGWYEVDRNGKKKYHELAAQPGAIRAVVRDMNGDKKPDIVVQMAQAREGLVLYTNQGKGRFVARELLTFPPSRGSSSFAFVDVDGDGTDEIVITAGDNGDYDAPPLKPYHGVYVFAANGKGGFVQRSFQHLDGAYGAIVRDFDGDGRRDMISYSYFPRFDRGDIDLLRYDRSVFTPAQESYTVANAGKGRWLVNDCADLNGDGKPDVVLGNVSIGPGVVPDEFASEWMSRGVVALLLLSKP